MSPRANKNTPPIDTHGNPIGDDDIVVACQAGSAEVDGMSYSVAAGERRRGSDPLVQAHGYLFAPDGTPAHERPNLFHAVVARADAERVPVEFELTLSGPLPTPLEREDVVQLTRAVCVRAGLVDEQRIATFDKGTVFPARSEIAALLPDDAAERSDLQFTRPKRHGR